MYMYKDMRLIIMYDHKYFFFEYTEFNLTKVYSLNNHTFFKIVLIGTLLTIQPPEYVFSRP